MFIRNCWYVAAWTEELSADFLTCTIINEPIVIYRKSDNSLVALEDRCAHRMSPLSLGKREGDDIRCMYHGLVFSPSGNCIEIPGQDKIPARLCVKSYPVVERHSWIWVWMGDPELADEDLIPPAHGGGNNEWFLTHNHLDYETNYMLICDNLTDFSHLGYVHTQSFGSDEQWAQKAPTITQLDRGIRMSRWLTSVPPIPPLGEASKHEAVDHWASYDFLVPGVLIFYNALYPVGTAAKANNEPPTEALGTPLYTHYSIQAVTPKTDKTTRYLYSWGPSKRLGTEEESEIMRKILLQAFLEDQVIIEAQHKVIELDPTRTPVSIIADKGVIMFQRTVERLIQEENKIIPLAATN